jgi:hypothetical protein
MICALAVDQEYLYCAAGGQIRRFALVDGRPAPFTGGSVGIRGAAIGALDVAGTTLYVADVRAGSVRMFDTESGASKGEFAAFLPTALAVDPIGQIWVAQDHGTLRAFRADGYAGVTYSGLDEVTSMAFGPGGRLYVADAKVGRVLTPGTGESGATFVAVLDRLPYLRAVGADNEGNLVTLQREPGADGARLAKWSAEKKLLWERSPVINAAPARP